jgi:MFS family permease
MALGVFLMSLWRADSSYFSQLFPAFVILAVGDGLAFVALTVAATTGVRPDQTGLASGLVNTSEQVGGALGLAILAEVASVVTSSGLSAGQGLVQANLHGYQQAFFYAAIMLVLALVIIVFVIRSPRATPRIEEDWDPCAYELDC